MLLRYLFDRFSLALILTVLVASLWSPPDGALLRLKTLTTAGIALLFFLHGARLPREAILGGITHWRLHAVVLTATFVLFPVLGWILRPLGEIWLSPELYLGILFLCALPSTVQSSIAFTSIAQGNVAAAVVAASLSNLAGVFLTPLLTALLISTQGGSGSPGQAVQDIFLLLLAPFVMGHLLRPWIGQTVRNHAKLLSFTDRGTILLVVYAAFAEAVRHGLWHQVPLPMLLILLVFVSVLLALIMGIIAFFSQRLGFQREDRIAIQFCGSKKSLATGIPMANILFAGNPALGLIVLPIMIFHQIQLMVCAVLARHFAHTASTSDDQKTS